MAKAQKNAGYMGNVNLPTKGSTFEYTQEQVEEIQKCQDNILHFAENYFYILNLDEGKQKIKLYAAQKRILRKLRDNRFFVLLASRQIGKSTLMTIYILWLANFYPDQKILLVANKEDTAIEIFQRVRMAYEMLPNWLKNPIDETLGGFAKTSMGLMNGSSISISTTTGTAARGKAVNCVDGETLVTLQDTLTGHIFDISMELLASLLENENGELHTILLDECDLI